MALTDKLTDIADAIRLKRDVTTPLSLEDMALQVSLIDGGGGTQVETIQLDARASDSEYALTPTLPVSGSWTFAIFGFYATNPEDRSTSRISNRLNYTSDRSIFSGYNSTRLTLCVAYKLDGALCILPPYTDVTKWIEDANSSSLSCGIYMHWGKNTVPITGFCSHD